jgi:hypothetical protein
VTASSPCFQPKSFAGEPSTARPALAGCATFAPTPTRASELGRNRGREKGPLLRRLRNWPGCNRGNPWIPDSESHVVRALSGEIVLRRALIQAFQLVALDHRKAVRRSDLSQHTMNVVFHRLF